ncbi:hypothetical protein [Methanolacinia paynteri]|uniref:hypothetical protein n=1 Tax=Methanolacinia paynteri TaxID=230356 RepID=UPI00064F2EAA|nr:hypothetical protein [Methanolacinia paynteri]
MRIVFGKEEKIGLMLLLAVIAISGVIFIVLDNAGKESFASAYSPSSEIGDLVSYDGEADEIIYTNTGGHLIVKSGNITIFIRNGAGLDPEPGMLIHTVGTVDIYNGEREIYVSEPADAGFINKTSGIE